MSKSFMLIGFVPCYFSVEISAKPIIAGYDVIGGLKHLDEFKANSINTYFRKLDSVLKMKLHIDENGKVISESIEEAF